MAISILRELANLELDMETSSDFSDKARAAFDDLISFVESGAYTNSDIEKFIAQNFRLKPAEIIRLYKFSGKKKSANTLRSQMSSLNLSLRSILRLEGHELYQIFLTDNEFYYVRFRALNLLFKNEVINISERFSFNILEYLPTVSESNVYAVEDCCAELEFLKRFDRADLIECISNLDINKLAYAFRVLSMPTYVREKHLGADGIKTSLYVSKINEDKLRFMSVLEMISL